MRAQPNPVHTEHASANSTTMLPVSPQPLALSHTHRQTVAGAGPAALAVMRGPGRGSAKSVNELEDTVSRSPLRALRQAAWSTSPEVAPNYGQPAAILARSGVCGACAAPVAAPQEGGLSVASEGDEPMSSAISDL